MNTNPKPTLSIIMISILIAYVVSYLVLSRTSYRLCKLEGVDGFFYVPGKPSSLITMKHFEAYENIGYHLYYPLWFIDRNCLGGPDVASVPMAGLKK